MTRQARCIAIASAVVILVAGCATRTHVELESDGAPDIALSGGADDEDSVSVIEAGAISAGTTSSVPLAAPAETIASPTTTDPTESTSAEPDGDPSDACPAELARLTDAVDGFVEEYGIAPVSEGELVATGHLRMMSRVYDVWIDGSIRATDDTCARPD